MSLLIANELMFSKAWESRSTYTAEGDIHIYDQDHMPYHGGIPSGYVQLDVRKNLNGLHPDKCPNMNPIGHAVKNVLKNLEIHDYITIEDRGWELSDYWATLEAIFIPKEEYENKILPKIEKVAQLALKREEKSVSSKKETDDSIVREQKPSKRAKTSASNQNQHKEPACTITESERLNHLVQQRIKDNPEKFTCPITQKVITEAQLTCPLTFKIMTDPVRGDDGYTYERSAIEKWLKKNRNSPITNREMSTGLRPHLALKKIIDEIVNIK